MVEARFHSNGWDVYSWTTTEHDDRSSWDVQYSIQMSDAGLVFLHGRGGHNWVGGWRAVPIDEFDPTEHMVVDYRLQTPEASLEAVDHFIAEHT